MVAVKSFDAAAWKPCVAGSAAECVSENTQAKDADMARLFKLPRHQGPMVWIRIPKDRRPIWWHEKGFVAPVAPLLANVWGASSGRPTMGKISGREAYPERVEKLHSWECIYYHRKDQIFLNAYVDDLKMVGKAENIKPMWESLRKVLDLDPETHLVDHVYLGCTQINHKPPKSGKVQTGILCPAEGFRTERGGNGPHQP